MSEKMMDEFEMVFPMPNHVMRCGKGYVATEYGAWQANDYCQKWIGWQASRAALVVELPSLENGLIHPFDGSSMIVDAVANQLNAAGVACK